jgi:thiol:disulfide interchange protein DsbD
MGLVAGLIASPCTGPVLASILTLISRQGGLWSGSLLMVIYGIGMGIPFLVLGTFSSVLARMPKSGAWMNVVKVIFSVSMICASTYYLYLGAKGLIAQSTATEFDAYAKLEDDLNKAKSAQKPVIIDFYADWCTSCKEIEEVTFREPRVAQTMREFEVIRIDISNPSASQTRIMDRFNVTTLPLILFFNRAGKLEEDVAVRGFIAPDQFLSRLKKVI